MRVLVTGGQGCIGAWVVKGLADRGIDVLMFDVEPEPKRLSLITGPETVRRVKVVLAYRCGAALDSHQVPYQLRARARSASTAATLLVTMRLVNQRFGHARASSGPRRRIGA